MSDPISAWAHTVYWPAWEAVGTCGAVILALWAIGRDGREARARDVARLQAIITVADGQADIFQGRLDRLDAGEAATSVAQAFCQREAARSGLTALDGIAIGELPTRQAIDSYMVIRSQTHLVDRVMHEAARREDQAASFALAASLSMAIDTIRQHAKLLSGERDRLYRSGRWL